MRFEFGRRGNIIRSLGRLGYSGHGEEIDGQSFQHIHRSSLSLANGLGLLVDEYCLGGITRLVVNN